MYFQLLHHYDLDLFLVNSLCCYFFKKIQSYNPLLITGAVCPFLLMVTTIVLLWAFCLACSVFCGFLSFLISIQFSHSVVSNSSRPHELQHARLSCPSPTPGACSNSCPLSWWCYPTISSSVILFFSCLQSFPASGSFPTSQFFASGGQTIGASASASVLPMNIQDWFPLGLIDWISLQSKGLSRVSPTPQLNSINSSVLSFLYSPTLTSIHDYWKNHSFDFSWLQLDWSSHSIFSPQLVSNYAFYFYSWGWVSLGIPDVAKLGCTSMLKIVCFCFTLTLKVKSFGVLSLKGWFIRVSDFGSPWVLILISLGLQNHQKYSWIPQLFLLERYILLELRDRYIPLEGFPGGSGSKEPVFSTGDPGSILGLGRSPGEGNGNSLQYSVMVTHSRVQ